MPTPISHAAVGFAVAAWSQRAPARRVCLVAAGCAALPDIDLIGWPLHVSSGSPFGHRAITHSLAFALAGALVAAALFFRDPQWTQRRTRIAFILALALASHACLDALSTYSLGVEFFAPFSQHRFRFPWTPLGDPTGNLFGQLVQEATFVFLPAVLLGWSGFRRRRHKPPPRPAAG